MTLAISLEGVLCDYNYIQWWYYYYYYYYYSVCMDGGWI